MMLLAPFIAPFLTEFPAIRLEIAVDDTSDIVSGGFDAGIQVGHRIQRDMTVLRIGDGFRMLTVAAPEYMALHERPSHPRDLHGHNCILFRSAWDHAILHWIFTKDGEQIEVAPEGTLTVNDLDLWLNAALDGIGVAYLPEAIAAPYLAQGRLVTLLDDWTRSIDGVFLYHPSRHQTPMPLTVFLRFIEKWRNLPRSM
jgi:DNA-binding transcriptional LysR family regulator